MDSTATVCVSFFANETDTRPVLKQFTLEELFETLTQHQERTHKRRGSLWSPFMFDGRRKGENLRESALLAFDIDDGTPPEQVADWLEGLTYFLASTHSSTTEHWKLRVGIALVEPIPAGEFASVWHSAVEKLLHGHVDPSTHDLARIFYLPTHQPGTTPYASIVWGKPFDWRTLPPWTPPSKPSLPDLEGIEGLDASMERRRAQGMLQKWCLDLANTVPTMRHATILRLGRSAGGLVGAGHLAYEEVYAEFLDAAEACGEIGDYGLKDVERAISDALDNGMSEPWTPSQFGDTDAYLHAPRVGALVRNRDEDEREYRVALPEFPLDVLPDVAREVIEQSSLPDAFLAGAGLGTISIALGNRVQLELGRTWHARSQLWIPLVGRASSGKSPSLDLMTAPLVERNSKAWEKYETDLGVWQDGDPSTRGAMPQPQDFLETGTLTVESLYMELARSASRGIVADELEQTLNDLIRYSSNGASGMGDLLKLWTGNPATMTRRAGTKGKNGIRLHIAEPHVTILGALIRDEQHKLGSTVSGSRPRWLVHPAVLLPGPIREPSMMALGAWKLAIDRLLDLRATPRMWTLDVQAQERFAFHRRRWQQRAQRDDQGPSVQAAIGKADTHLGRVTLDLAEMTPGLRGRLVVPFEVVDRAARWIDFVLDSWDYLGEAMLVPLARNNDRIDPKVDAVYQWIEGRSLDPLSEIDENGVFWVSRRSLRRSRAAQVRSGPEFDEVLRRYAVIYPGMVDDGKSVSVTKPSPRVGIPGTRLSPMAERFDPVDSADSADSAEKVGAKSPDTPQKLVPNLQKVGAKSPKVGAKSPKVGAKSRDLAPTEKNAKVVARARAREEALWEAREQTAPTLPYTVISDVSELPVALTVLSRDLVAVDTETTGLQTGTDRLRLIQLSDGDTTLVVDFFMIDHARAREAFLTLFGASSGPTLVFHNAGFDIGFLSRAGIEVNGDRVFDLLTMANVLDSSGDFPKFDLHAVADRYLSVKLDKTLQSGPWNVETLHRCQYAYAAEDARVTAELGKALRGRARHAQLQRQVLDLEQQAQAPIYWLATAGVPADRDLLARTVDNLEQEIAQQTADLHALSEQDERLGLVLEAMWQEEIARRKARNKSGQLKKLPPKAERLQWTSSDQVLRYLRARGLAIEQTNKNALAESQSTDEFVPRILALRSNQTVLGKLLELRDAVAEDGRIYAVFRAHGASTGRTSADNPNLQNIAHRTDARAAIRPEPGKVFVRADYSQLQLVIIAHVTQDETLCRLIRDGQDAHAYMASRIHNCTPAEVKASHDDWRQQAKAVFFGFAFGAGAERFRVEQRKLGLVYTLAEAQAFHEAFYSTFEGIRAWHRRQPGYKVPVTINDPNGMGRVRRNVQDVTQKLNTPIQMVEANGFKLALRRLYDTRGEVPSTRLVAMIHDELIAECSVEDAAAVAAWLKREMVDGMQPLVGDVPIRVDATFVRSYADADKKGYDPLDESTSRNGHGQR